VAPNLSKRDGEQGHGMDLLWIYYKCVSRGLGTPGISFLDDLLVE
jgi:hypothetical protein